MASVGSIFVQLGLQAKEFHRGLDNAVRTMQKASGKIQKAGKNMATGLSVPLAGIGTMAIAGAVEVDKSQGMIQSKLGITQERAEELQGVVSNLFKDGLGANMGEVETSVADVIRYIESLEGASDESIQKVAENTLNLNKVFGTESREISRSVDALQKSFDGLDTKKTFDLITKGFQNGLDFSGEFLETLNEYSPHFDAMNFSADEMFNIFSSASSAGVYQLDKVGDLVKELNIRLSDGTADDYMSSLSKGTQNLYTEFKKTGEGGNEVFQSIMKDIGGMENSTEAYTIGVGLMGTQFEDLEVKAVTAMGNAGNAMEGTKGSMDALNTSANSGLGVTLTSAFREVSSALQPLGEALGGLVEKYLPPIVDMAGKLATWFSNLSSKSQLLVIGLGGVATVLPFLMMGFGLMVSAMSGIGKVFGVVGKVAGKIVPIFNKVKGALNFARILPLLTGPVGIAIAVVGGLIAVGIAIWKNWDTIKAKAVEIWGSISTFFSETWTSISEGVSGFLTGMVEWFSEKFTSIKDKTVEIFEGIWTFISEWGLKLLSFTPIGAFVNLIVTNWQFIKDTTAIIFQLIKDVISIVFNKIYDTVAPIVSGIIGFISDRWAFLKNVTTRLFLAVFGFLHDIWTKVYDFVSGVVTKVVDYVSEKWGKIRDKTTEIFGKVYDKVSTVFGDMKDKVMTKAGEIKATVEKKFNEAKEKITGPIEDAKDTVSDLIDDIKSFFTNLKLKIPMPKVPKFSVKTATSKFMGKEIQVPKFDVSWNAKGNIFNGASILGGGQGVGEAGAEVVMPIQRKRYMKPYASMVAELMDGMDGGKNQGTSIVNKFEIAELVVREEADVKRIAEELERIQTRNNRAKGTLAF